MPNKPHHFLTPWLLGVMVSLSLAGQVQARQPSQTAAQPFDPTRVEVVVVGVPHLQQIDQEDWPATALILRILARFAPDHIALEWLHPGIDPATTTNYAPLENPAVLAKLWGVDRAQVDTTLTQTADVLRLQQSSGLPSAPTRVALGKLYYLRGDLLNAAYQWWIADQEGEGVSDLKRLTYDNFSRHEIGVWGFPLAYEQGLAYLTPFDYQGEDAAWIWMEIVEAVMVHAIEQRHGLHPGEAGWDTAAAEFGSAAEAYANGRDPAWLSMYGDIKEVAEFAEVVDIWTARRSNPRAEDDPTGLSQMRYVQSSEHTVDKRYMYDAVFPKISLHGLGQRLVDNWILRNRRMVDFVEQDIKRLHRSRVLLLVGEGHRPFLDDEFVRRGYRVRPAEALFNGDG